MLCVRFGLYLGGGVCDERSTSCSSFRARGVSLLALASQARVREPEQAEPQQPESEPGVAEPAAKPAVRRVAVIPKGTTHEFWKSVHAGANKAGKELGIEIIWKGPVREDDRDEQIKVVESFVASGVSAIVLAPLDDTALVPAVTEATQEGIPVVIIDSDIKCGRVS